MRITLSIACCLAAIPLLASGATPVASVTSAQPFTLDGRAIATPGVTTWPVVIGDELASDPSSPLLVNFRDGSVVKLASASRAKFSGTENRLKFVLLAGNLDFKLVPGSTVSVVNLDVDRKQVNNSKFVPPPAPRPNPAVMAAAAPDGSPADDRPAASSPVQDQPASGVATGAASSRITPVLRANPKFLIPVAGTSVAGLTSGLLTIPPVSRHF